MVAKLAGVSRQTVLRWVDNGWLECGRIQLGRIEVRTFDDLQQRRAMRLAKQSRSRTPMVTRHDHTRTNPDGTRRRS